LKYIITILLAFYGLAFTATQEEALTSFMVSQVYDSVKVHFPGRFDKPLYLTRTEKLALLRNDTLFIPQEFWGYKSTNDNRLQFLAAIILYEKAFSLSRPDTCPENFFLNSGRAGEVALKTALAKEKDTLLLSALLLTRFVYAPLTESKVLPTISRDYGDERLKFKCMLLSYLNFRTDSTRVADWLDGTHKVDYAITGVAQVPHSRKEFEITLSLRNLGNVAIPLECLVDMNGHDTLIRIAPFLKDSLVRLTLSSSVLKVVLDPYLKLYDVDKSNQQFVSMEFKNKRKAFLMVSMVIWNLLAAIISYALMLLAGIFIHRLTTLYFSNHIAWTAIFITVLVLVKAFLPAFFFGFTLWGLLYNLFFIESIVSPFILMCSTACMASLVYYAFRKDEANLKNVRVFVGYCVTFSMVEPLLSGLFFFFK